MQNMKNKKHRIIFFEKFGTPNLVKLIKNVLSKMRGFKNSLKSTKCTRRNLVNLSN